MSGSTRASKRGWTYESTREFASSMQNRLDVKIWRHEQHAFGRGDTEKGAGEKD